MTRTQLSIPKDDIERDDQLAEMENCIASGEMEGVVFTPEMRDQLRQFALGQISMEEITELYRYREPDPAT